MSEPRRSPRLIPIPEPDHAWERQPYESDESFHAFTVYRDLGVERSLEKTGKRLGRSKHTMAEQASRDGWSTRAAQYDAYLDAERLRIRFDEFRDMERRHAQTLAAAFGSLVMPIAALGRPRRIGDRLVDRRDEIDTESTATLVRLAQESARIMGQLAGSERMVRTATLEDRGAETGPPGPATGAVPADEARLAAVYAAMEESGLVLVPPLT